MAIPRFNRTASINTSLFSGYINARNEWSYTELQLTILNMLMFAPQGFSLPCLTRQGEHFSVGCHVSYAFYRSGTIRFWKGCFLESRESVG